MAHFDDRLAGETAHCDWCRNPIQVGQAIAQVGRDAGDVDRVPVDARWFHSRCARQFVADPFW